MVQKIKSSNLDADILTGNTELAEAANNTDTVLVHDTSAGALKKIQVSNLTAQAGDGLAKSNSTLSVDIANATLLDAGAASGDLILVYDASAGALKRITQTNFLNFPTVSSVSPTSLSSGDGTGNYTIVITGQGFTAATASLVNDSGSVISFDSQTVDSATQITGVIAKSSLPGSGEPYDVRVAAASGLQSTLDNQINIDQQPAFSTAAGSLGSVADGARGSSTFTVVAADPESGGDVTYTLESGSLPAGCSLTSTSSGAVLSGFNAVGTNTTSTFTIRAKDVNSNISDREFSITVLAPAYQSFTSSGTFSVPSGLTAVTVLVVAGGGGGGGDAGAGGGAGGLIYRPAFPVTPGGTVTVTVGDGGGAAPGGGQGTSGQDSVFGTLTAKGGGGGGGAAGGTGIDGGSAGGGRSGTPGNSGGAATQPTQPGDSGTYGFGNAGGGGAAQSTARPGAGGGGGAGASGQTGGQKPNASGSGGDGGIGKAYTISDGTTSVYYAGGGGGGYESGPKPAAPTSVGVGGQGGGGNGGHRNSTPAIADASEFHATPATANRGGGGGGAGEDNYATAGGKGIVIVSY